MAEGAAAFGAEGNNNGSDFEETSILQNTSEGFLTADSTVELSREMEESMQDAYKSDGPLGLKRWLDINMNQWKTIPLKIAIAGESGAGKSTLINVLRGLQDNDPKAAPVGVTETTTEPTAYEEPVNEQLVYWDLPGLGTDTFRKEKYLEKVKYSDYDYFIIVYSTRLTENGLWLATEVRKQNKKFMFVRTKVGDDVRNNKRQRKSEFETLETLRYDMKKHLQMHFEEEVDYFLIDSHMLAQFEFGHLQKTLVDNLPEHKKEAMVLSLSAQTKQVIIEKSERLKKRILLLSAVSGIAAGVPLPGLGAVVDVVVLINEVRLYEKQFGFDKKTMRETAVVLGMSVKEIEDKLALIGLVVSASSKTAVGIASVTAMNIGQDAVSIAVPIIGGIMAAGASFAFTLATLRTTLGRMKEGALMINTEFEKLLK